MSPLPMRRPRMLQGHLGSMASALVDGQLDTETAERAWQHVHGCLQCRRLVEREGWVKRRLAQATGSPQGARADDPPESLVGSLLHLDATALAWAEAREIEDSARMRRRLGIALAGAGSVSAAVIGLTALGGLPLGPTLGHTPATSLRDAHTTPTRAVVSPPGGVHGRLPGWTVTAHDGGVAHATPVARRP
jgi:hypothetical protein